MNRYLLDTHTFIWWVEDSPRLSAGAREVISNLENECYFSLASAWEMAIKSSLGKLELTIPLKRFITEHMAANDFEMLSITFSHTSKVEHLPFHHRDPFDRLLIAQSISENMPIVSGDNAFYDYEVERIW